MNPKLSLLVLLLFVVLAFTPSAHAFDFDFYTDCEKYPDSLGCMVFGDPPAPEQVPQESRQLEQQTGPVFAGGGCPANVVVTVGGVSYTALNMAQACNWIEIYMRPLVLLFAAISAVFIVAPRD